MNDNLENFIRNNKEEFNDKEPSSKVWNKIEASLTSKSASVIWWNNIVIWRAAAMLFMAISMYLIIPKAQMQQENKIALKEFADVEAFYFEQISDKVEIIDGFKRNEGVNGFTHDFQQLEAMYMVLKEEMKARPSDKVKDALVLNLLVRINLLNQEVHKLDKLYKADRKKKESNI